MNRLTFDLLSVPYIEALQVLNLEYVIEPDFVIKVSRDSICREFSWVSEHKVYDHAYHEIKSYVEEYFDWYKLDDDWFILKIREYVEENNES